MARGTFKEFYDGGQILRIVERYDFPLFSCECGKVHKLEDFLKFAADALRKGKVTNK